MATSRAELRDRRRRRRQDSEQEILDAAERLLRERPFRELTIDDVMAATSQSRTAFYRHFTDRQELLIRLLHDLADDLYAVAETWLDGGDEPLTECRQAIERLVGVYEEHGRQLRAISDAASDDDEVELVYDGLVQRFIDATEARMRRDAAAGRLALSEVRQVATALCWMSERYLANMFSETSADRAAAVIALDTIWVRTLYGVDPYGHRPTKPVEEPRGSETTADEGP